MFVVAHFHLFKFLRTSLNKSSMPRVSPILPTKPINVEYVYTSGRNPRDIMSR
ncbi:hypothetical protein RO3G_09742 [Rhizopus delemar RA 99-880]|uniref:Uncharacterized protein n=1 Tax=Rhizopus delemar (strain RA 99-880 / ATCC MYA-4621 / FGSC 9543 / NRRL 43880) TaxID=246409 RepID=I1C9A2_RHIO9|nr:hypothetical protein RO3G_09742 [Rhizopus delemar RA 99-880]|eukprot:EIE85032.1 hypothetical protein RO3G_09742 [Rhizopus delemar RA 99-880]